jgi:dTDP-4-amino-4,6-dideoxygalactose transaminase
MRATLSRRNWLGSTAALVAGGARVWAKGDDTPAILGGKPVRSARPTRTWPIIGDEDATGLLDVLRSGVWNRLNGRRVAKFEEKWAEMLGAKHVLATSSGTTALFAALNALGVGPGDEVIVPTYTFVATINAVLLQYALPVFVDTDPETFQIDARKVESAITDRTACLLPAHIGGNVADMDALLPLAEKRKLPLLEDACQAHLAEWRGKKVGTLGTIGCFSFQASKHLNSAEGGALVTNDPALIESARAFHNNGRGLSEGGLVRNGCNLRLTEFQGALLASQAARLESQSRTREDNARYLTTLLHQVPGVTPAALLRGCTRNAYHLFMFRYDAEQFAGLPRKRFLEALAAEGVPASGGYEPLEREPFLKETLLSKSFRAVYPEARLREALERMHCPVNERLCAEAVWLTQGQFLGGHSDMDQIAEAVRKVQRHAARIAKA